MKWVISGVLLFLLVSALEAQNKDQERNQLSLQEYILYQDDKALRIQAQNQIPIKDQLELNDGSIVSNNGRYWNSLGEQFQLHKGECLDIDGNRYASQDRLRLHIPIHIQAMNQLHYLFDDGKLYRIRDQLRIPLLKRVKLQSEITLNPDGSFNPPNQQKIHLRDGECLDSHGNLYESESQFRQYTQLRLQALAKEHYVLKDGRIYYVQNQRQTQVSEPLKLQSGIEIHPDGYFQARDEKPVQLVNGECVDADGNLFGSQEQFQQHALIHVLAMNQRHFLYQNKTLWLITNGEKNQVHYRLNMQNGLAISPDGTYKLRNESKVKLKEGECLDPDGNKYASQDQFHEQAQSLIMAEPYFSFQNGTIVRTQNQIQSQLHSRWSFMNGTAVDPDGTYKIKNVKNEQLNNGEYLDREGNRYGSADQFKKKINQVTQDRMVAQEQEKNERKTIVESAKRVADFE